MKRVKQGVCIFLILLFSNPASGQEFIGTGAIIISHMSPDYDQAADEFVVLYNTTADTLDLNGYEIRYFTASGSSGSAGRSFLVATIIPPFEHLLLASNDTVTVGTVTVVRDGPFSAGMAATGGQLVLRSSNSPDSIVYAAAWGSVSQYVAGMSDAASWTSDGMAVLLWQDSVYVRASYIGSNAEYVHVSSDSITFLPSLSGETTSLQSFDWEIPVSVVQGLFSDSSVVLGLDEDATDGFDHLLDRPIPPPPAGSSIVSGVYRPDMGLATGDHLLYDIRPLHAHADTTTQWFLDVWPAESGSALVVDLDLTGLPAYLPVQLRDLASGSRVDRDASSLTYEVVPSTSDVRRFLIVLGDTTAPWVGFLEPSEGDVVVAGTSVRVTLSVEEKSGIESFSVIFIDLSGPSEHPVRDTTDRIDSLVWRLPRRLYTDSARFDVFLRDSMGNTAVYVSPQFRVTPDTMRITLVKGWHSFSIPLGPVGSEAIFFPEDSVYVFDYMHRRGYAVVDSVVPGIGYFVGLISGRQVELPGVPVIDSFTVPLSVGFSLIANPTGSTIARDDLVFREEGMEYPYGSAMTNGIISGGFFGYDHASGQYHASDSLEPWKAYWIPVLVPSVSVRFPDAGHQGSLRVASTMKDEWEIRFRAEARGVSNTLFSIGVHPHASDGFDNQFDVPAPPLPPGNEGIHVYANHPSWETLVGTRFLRDIRTMSGATVWNFTVSSPQAAITSLMWGGGSGAVPEGIEIRDMTQDTEGWKRLTKDWRYDFDGGSVRHFAVRMTTTNITQEATGVPETFTVLSNYPNPFNGMTTLSVTIPEQGKFSVRIYDLLGRVVDMIDDQDFSPGRHVVSWRSWLSSGIYLGEATFRPGGAWNDVQVRRWRMVMMR